MLRTETDCKYGILIRIIDYLVLCKPNLLRIETDYIKTYIIDGLMINRITY